MDECSVPNLVTVRPMPKQFPIELCSFKINAKELLRSGVLTESGKREIVFELLHAILNHKLVRPFTRLMQENCAKNLIV